MILSKFFSTECSMFCHHFNPSMDPSNFWPQFLHFFPIRDFPKAEIWKWSRNMWSRVSWFSHRWLMQTPPSGVGMINLRHILQLSAFPLYLHTLEMHDLPRNPHHTCLIPYRTTWSTWRRRGARWRRWTARTWSSPWGSCDRNIMVVLFLISFLVCFLILANSF